jgi:hypothetical protein
MTLDTYADLFDRDADAVADAHDQRLSGFVFPAIAATVQPNGGTEARNHLSISS